ncbi:MAG: hypothetical protein DDT25_00433 [Chloroflexi bacterium]|nr:hypothetical protein [Chloroflexota bacterium]
MNRLVTYSKQGVFIPTRGRVRDIGPGVSHKSQAMHLYLKGFTPTEIARMTNHDPHNVDRYLRDFEQVYDMVRDGASLNKICFLSR